MKIYDNPLYIEDIELLGKRALPWERLRNSSMLISGASGLIGSCIVDLIMKLNEKADLNCSIYAVGRNAGYASERFAGYMDKEQFHFIKHDINDPDTAELPHKAEYILHLASNTHPRAYATDPVGTIMSNVTGTQNLLEFAAGNGAERFVFASSNEVYGENRGDIELFDEKYCGYIDCNTLRAGYPESKRCGEALCQAYISQKGVDCVIMRLTRSYGPTMLKSDSKAISQFILKALQGEDIVLKSEGTQYYSYTYVIDAVAGLMTGLLSGEKGEAYNIADKASDITLKELASLIAGTVDKKVIFELPDEIEKAGYSKATKARLDGTKLKQLGWRPVYDIKKGITRTIDIMRDL